MVMIVKREEAKIWAASVVAAYTRIVADKILPIATSLTQTDGRVSWPTHKSLPENPDYLKALVLLYMHFCI